MEMQDCGAKSIPSSLHLAHSHQQKTQFVLSVSDQRGVVFECVKSKRLVRVLDRPAELAAFLVSHAESVIRPTQAGQVSPLSRRLERFFIDGDRTIVCVILDM